MFDPEVARTGELLGCVASVRAPARLSSVAAAENHADFWDASGVLQPIPINS